VTDAATAEDLICAAREESSEWIGGVVTFGGFEAAFSLNELGEGNRWITGGVAERTAVEL
jgi:hypothetical protein